MDTFMDKLAQKLTAQEMIKANSAAETEEMDRLREQVEEYKECLEKLKRLLEEGATRFEESAALLENGTAKLENVQIDGSNIERLVEEGISRLEQSGNTIERITDVSMAKLRQMEQNEELLEQVRQLENKVAELTQSQEENLTDLGSILEKKIMQIPFLVEEKMTELPGNLASKMDEKMEEMHQMEDAKFLEQSEAVHRECVKVYRNVQAVVVEENAKQQEQIESVLGQSNGNLNKIFNISVAALVVSAAGLIVQLLAAFHIL